MLIFLMRCAGSELENIVRLEVSDDVGMDGLDRAGQRQRAAFSGEEKEESHCCESDEIVTTYKIVYLQLSWC